MKPAISDPSQVEMNIYYTIVSYDSKLFKKFMLLSRGMRKHLLFFVMDEIKIKVIE